MSRYCLDTSAYSHFRNGHQEVTGLLDAAEWIGVPAVILGELRIGFLLGSRMGVNTARLREFIDHPAVEVLPIDDSVSQHYAEIVVQLRRAGTPLPINDAWIAACAARHGAPVLTFDQHFKQIERIGLVLLHD